MKEKALNPSIYLITLNNYAITLNNYAITLNYFGITLRYLRETLSCLDITLRYFGPTLTGCTSFLTVYYLTVINWTLKITLFVILDIKNEHLLSVEAR